MKKFVNVYLVTYKKPSNDVQVYGTLELNEDGDIRKHFEKVRNAFSEKTEYHVVLENFSALEKYGHLNYI